MNLLVTEYLERIETRIAAATDAVTKADAEVDLALCQLRGGHAESASLMLDKVFADCRALTAPEQAKVMSLAMYGVGIVYYQCGRYAEAVSQLLNANEAARIAHMPQIGARALAFLAVACARQGAHRDGLDYGLAGLEAGIKTNDLRAIVTARLGIATLHNERNQPARAMSYLDEVIASVDALGDPFTQTALVAARAATSVFQARTVAERVLDDPFGQAELKAVLETARQLSDESLVHARASGHRPAEISALGNLADVAFMADHTTEAIKLMGQAFALAKEVGSVDNMALARMVLAKYQLKIGRVEEALGNLNEAFEYAKQSGLLEAETDILQKLSECYERLGRPGEALDALKRYARQLELQREVAQTDIAALTAAEHAIASARGNLPPRDVEPEDDRG
jgi:tetratricopeptide (TPR) repeat protein